MLREHLADYLVLDGVELEVLEIEILRRAGGLIREEEVVRVENGCVGLLALAIAIVTVGGVAGPRSSTKALAGRRLPVARSAHSHRAQCQPFHVVNVASVPHRRQCLWSATVRNIVEKAIHNSMLLRRMPHGIHVAKGLSMAGGVRKLQHVLIVDDHPDTAETLGMLFRVWGYEAWTATTGAEGLDLAFETHAQILLLDITMPGLHGTEVCRRIRQENWGKGALIIAMTGWTGDAHSEATMAAGCDYHLIKPIDLDLLKRLLREWHSMPLR